MTRLALVPFVAALFGFILVGADPPDGWSLAGNDRDAYEAGVAQDADRSGAVATLSSTTPSPEGFGTLMQTVDAEAFRGKRVHMTAYVRTEGVSEWAGLWVRVDGAGSPAPALAFDNMQDRPITGTSGWAPYSVVVDVPETAHAVAFGALLDGPRPRPTRRRSVRGGGRERAGDGPDAA